MPLYLIRHGETPLNAARVLQPADTPLSARGEHQAAALAVRLADAGLAGILSSDLPRARRTAAHLADATGLPVVTSALLRERNFGALRGQPLDALQIDLFSMDDAPPDGESRAQFEQRVAEAVAHALRLQAALGGPLAVVTHGLVLRAWIERHALRGNWAWPAGGLHNASISVVSTTPPHRVERLGCTAHLSPDDTPMAGTLCGG